MKNLKKYPLIDKAARLLLPLGLVGLCFSLLFFAFDEVTRLSVSSTSDRLEGLLTASSANALFTGSAESQELNRNLEGAQPQQAMPLQSLFALDNQMKGKQIMHAQATSNTYSIELKSNPDWLSFDVDQNNSVAWGDVDRDGDLDLAVGAHGRWDKDCQCYLGKVKLYLNQPGGLSPIANWQSDDNNNSYSVAWADVDNDGDLDLAVGNRWQPNKLYLNDGGALKGSAVWTDEINDPTTSVAWGDVNGDGYFDLAVGNWGRANRIYLNQDGVLEKEPSWSSQDKDKTRSVAWADVDRDRDGKLELAVGNWGQTNKVYFYDYIKEDHILTTTYIWTDTVDDYTVSVAWGDIDNDGYPELAVGNLGGDNVGHDDYLGSPNKLYQNQKGVLTTPHIWTDKVTDQTTSLAWGDVDRDGYLDLAVANNYGPTKVYLNQKGRLSAAKAWESNNNDTSWYVAWGDVDNDGDLDLAVATRAGSNKLYHNSAKVLDTKLAPSKDYDLTYDVAWGDMDNDGDLDLAVANDKRPNMVYLNQDGKLAATPVWSDTYHERTYALAWGDYDGDGDLDLAIANRQGHNRIYRNQNGMLDENAYWSSKAHNDYTTDVAWADYDGDGDLDLAVANRLGANHIYLNQGVTLTDHPSWLSEETDYSWSLAWGDMDNDGDLDLAVANSYGPNKLYQNQGGQLERSASWQSNDKDNTYDVAWGDYDSDGDLDLAVANNQSPNKVYLNQGGVLSADPFWFSKDTDYSSSVAWGDMDNDGDLDLAIGNRGASNKVYLNQDGILTTQAFWRSDDRSITRHIAWGDMDADGDLDLASGNQGQTNKLYLNQRSAALYPSIALTKIGQTAQASHETALKLAPADFYALPTIQQSPIIPITYTLFHPNSNPMQVRASYSLNGGGKWVEAKPVSLTKTSDLDTSPSGVAHTYLWDVFNSGFFGQSDNVVFRLEAEPGFKPITSTVPGPFQRSIVSAQTYPFGVRGSQVRVLSGTHPIANALVYHLPAGQTRRANVLGKSHEQPFLTDSEGYLQGRGELAIGDTLVAMLPVSKDLLSFDEIELDSPLAEHYTLYYTSPVLTDTALTAHTISQWGVQTVTVSADNPLLLFNLDVSLEWDASQNKPFMKQLEYDLRRTSELLYDWTDGQAALEELTIYHDREKWDEADIRIYATNRLRPHASTGGIVSRTLSDPDNATIKYQPGHVEIGSSWNRYGNRSGTLGEDWPRALAHELGHYLFFLGDNYLGFDDDSNHLISIEDCRSAMSNPYRSDVDYSEFLPQDRWSDACLKTLSQKTSGRSDWATIEKFYPSLSAPTSSTITHGPSLLPLEVTQVSFEPSETATTTLALPIFYLTDDSGGRVSFGSAARAYLLQKNQLIDLGQPTLDQVLARGARLGDKLCVFEASRFGCKKITAGDEQLIIHEVLDWQPDVIVSPINGGIRVEVSNLTITPDQSVSARLYPINDTAPPAMTITTTSTLDRVTFTFNEQPKVGYVHVQVDDGNPNSPPLETITTYSVHHGSPIPIPVGGGTIAFAPMMSSDGQVVLYDHNEEQDENEFDSLQNISNMPATPRWVDVVGPVYRLIASQNRDLFDMSITFNYLEQDVLAGKEESLRIYYLAQESNWQALTTTLDIEHNFASASIQGTGLYALMSGQPIKLETGWNLFAYPLWTTQPITDTLAPIDGKYTIVCGYDREDTQDPWKVYRVDDLAQQNDLQQLEYGHGYWIKVTEPITFSLRGAEDQSHFTNSMSRETLPPTPEGCEAAQETPTTLDIIYIVQRYDTMYRIAKSHQTTVRAIIEANGLPNAYLQIGQQLIIPGRTGR